MLKKHDGINIPNDDPFKNDKLNRQPLIENLTKLITDLNQPFVISINSPWGTGKTVFIKMWEQYLETIILLHCISMHGRMISQMNL